MIPNPDNPKTHFINLIRFVGMVFLVVCGNVLQGQNSKLDSLRTAIAQEKTDTSRILLIIELADDLYKTEKDSALQLLQSAITTAEKINFQSGLFELWFTSARIHLRSNQLESAFLEFNKAKEIASQANDKIRQIRALNAISYSVQDKRLGIPYLNEALDIASVIGNKLEQARVMTSLGIVYSNLTEFDKAEDFYLQTLAIYKEKGNKKSQADILRNLGNNAGRSNNLEKALEYYDQGILIMRELGEKSEEAAVYKMKAYANDVMGNYPEALANLQAALKLLEADGNNSSMADCYNRISNLYLSMEDYTNALFYIEKCYELWEQSPGKLQKSELLSRKGSVYILKEEYDSALLILHQSYSLSKANAENISVLDCYNIGYCYEQLKQPDSALVFLNLALSIAEQSNDVRYKSKILKSLGSIHFRQGNTAQALEELTEALNVAKAGGNKEEEMEASEVLYRIYKSKNNSEKALYFFETHRNLQDSLFNEKNLKQIGRLEANYEFEKEKQQLTFQQEKELEQQRVLRRSYLIALSVLLLFSGIIYRYYRSKQKANEKLSKLNEQVMQQKEKLEELDIAKSRFFTNISHEFRTPLTIISGMASQIMENPRAWSQKGGEMIKQNSANLLHLVNQILDLRKLEAKELKLNMVQGNVVKYLHYLTQSYEPYVQSKGLQIHFLPAIEKLNMDYDPEKLLRIISNLLSNAIKYTPDKGNIYVHVNQLNEMGQPFLQIRVEDTGAGIASDKLPHIFDRFYQVEDASSRSGEGTGIGLALTKELVTLMNGMITVQSTPGKGSIFTVLLPITNESPVSEVLPIEFESPTDLVPNSLRDRQFDSLQFDSPTVKPPEDQDWRTAELKTANLPTLLIVEDNPDIRQFLVACLENKYQLETATNGQEGIDLALETVPDLIISDVMMPEKDGFELCETLKNDERTSHVPIILLTAKADMESKISGLKTGADAYLTKPFEQEELLVRLEKLFELRQKLQARYRSFEPEALPENKEDEFVQKVRQVVLQNLSDDSFGIPQLCRAVALSRAQLHNKLKALTGQSTSHFVRTIRLHKAKELLESSELNISEIGYEVGFRNPSHFSSAYQEEFGVTPSKTRN